MASPAPSRSNVAVSTVGASPRDLKAFVRIQHDLASHDNIAVLPLLGEVMQVLSAANPYWCRAQRSLWRAERDGRAIGRVAAILDPEHERLHGERCAYFGFLECIEEASVALEEIGRAHV